MRLRIFSKEAHEIKSAGISEGWEKCEKHYLAELENQRKKFEENRTIIHTSHKKEIEEIERNLKSFYTNILIARNLALSNLSEQIKNDREGIKMLNSFIPELADCVSAMRTRAELKLLETSRDYQSVETVMHRVECIEAGVNKIMPKVKNLFKIDGEL